MRRGFQAGGLMLREGALRGSQSLTRDCGRPRNVMPTVVIDRPEECVVTVHRPSVCDAVACARGCVVNGCAAARSADRDISALQHRFLHVELENHFKFRHSCDRVVCS